MTALTDFLTPFIGQWAIYARGVKIGHFNIVPLDPDGPKKCCTAPLQYASIDPQYKSIPPSEWMIHDTSFSLSGLLGSLIPLSEACLKNHVVPSWATVNTTTGQVTVPNVSPSQPPKQYTPSDSGTFKDTSGGILGGSDIPFTNIPISAALLGAGVLGLVLFMRD